MLPQEYKYDVFLSWTGKDRDLKESVKQHLQNAGLVCYDSEVECKGQFRSDYVNALQNSKVYLILLTDNLRNNPNVSGFGTFTEVRREVSVAMDLESHGDLNIVLLNFSEFFCYRTVFRDISDQVGWFFYTSTRGFSRTDALDGLTDDVCNKVVCNVQDFVTARNAGAPKISQKPQLGILDMPVVDCDNFSGRSDELEAISKAFYDGAKAVVLSGMGGIGKTSIAKHFAKMCKENHTFVCPQIVRVQYSDSVQSGDTYGTFISSVAYSDDVAYSHMSDAEKRRRQEHIIANLPEYVVLIVDNFTALSNEEVQVFLQKIKCRLLITTRLHVDDLDETQVKQISVDKLPCEEARNVFDKIAAQQVDATAFEKLYNAVAGHTITLCLVAKAVKAHKMGLTEILEELSSTGEISENVVHIDGGDNRTNATVSAHLQKLFSIAGFENDEGCKAVLRNLAVMADGKLSCDLLCNQLGFHNRNQLNKLIEYGWVLPENNGDEVYLHPVLSLIANRLLVPTSQNAQVAVQYLCQKAQMRNQFTYKNVGFVCESLALALVRLAQNEGALCVPLWDEFVVVCRLVSDMDAVRGTCGKLCALLKDTNEKSKVQMYADMYLLERCPTNLEVVSPYLANLQSSAEDYKFVLRSLSVTSQYLVPTPQHKKMLVDTLRKAFDAAAAKNDHIPAMALGMELLACDGKNPQTKAAVQRYVASHKQKDASLHMLNITQNMVVMSPNGMYGALGILDSDNPVKTVLGAIFKHPIATIKLATNANKLKKIDKSDELYNYMQFLFRLSDNWIDNDNFDLESFFLAVKELFQLQVRHEITLLDFSTVLQNAMYLVKHLPVELQGDLQKIVDVEIFDPHDFTVEQYANLSAAFEISCWLGNRQSIDKALTLLTAQRTMHGDEHVDVLGIRLKLASQYAFFKNYRESYNQYRLVYNVLKHNAQNSSKLFETCNAILAMLHASKIEGDSWLRYFEEYYNTGASVCEEFGGDHLTLTVNYIKCLNKIGSRKAQLLEDTFVKWMVENCAKFVANSDYAYASILRCLDYILIAYTNKLNFEKANELLVLMQKLGKKAKRDEKVKTTLCVLEDTAYIAMYKSESNAAELFEKAISYGLKHKTNFDSKTAIALWLRFSEAVRYADTSNPFPKAFLNWDSDKQQKEIAGIFSCICGVAPNYFLLVEHKTNILKYYGKAFCEKNYSQNFGIDRKDFKKCKTVLRYKRLLLESLWNEFYKLYANGQRWNVELQKGEKQNKFVYRLTGSDIFISVNTNAQVLFGAESANGENSSSTNSASDTNRE